MFIEKEIPIFDFVSAISETVDLVSPALNLHHQKAAYIAYRIAEKMELSEEEVQDIILASMLHDIGAFSAGENINDPGFGLEEGRLYQHSLLGYKLLKNFAPLSNAAKLINYHHKDFDTSNCNVPMGSYIIHLAGCICALFDEQHESPVQVSEVLEKISLMKSKFHPDVLNAFYRISGLEYFQAETFSPSHSERVLQKVLLSKKIIGEDALKNFARVVAHIIDFRSKFTAAHSSGVAAIARELTAILGFSERECKLMEIAGLLHDFGKLAIPNNILEKNDGLNNEEYDSIKKHTYYTHAALSRIGGLEDIASWAAFHHERQDGNGYFFRIKGKEFSKLARIMAVSDVFSALTEDRPYRPGMNRMDTTTTLADMAINGGIDKNITWQTIENFNRINNARAIAQQEARSEYANFHETISEKQHGKYNKQVLWNVENRHFPISCA